MLDQYAFIEFIASVIWAFFVIFSGYKFFLVFLSIKERIFWRVKVMGCKCFHWSQIPDFPIPEPQTFSLPAPIPEWPPGSGFAGKIIKLGELEVYQATKFEFIWGYNVSPDGKQGISFYKPIGIPEGFSNLGHYCQSNGKPLHGFVLVTREAAKLDSGENNVNNSVSTPALQNPVDYTLVWSSNDGRFDMGGYFWSPQPPTGYKALGFIVTNKSRKPELEEIKCVRADLSDECEAHCLIGKIHSKYSEVPFGVWNTRPLNRGIYGRGVSVGTFSGGCYCSSKEKPDIACLKNLDPTLHAMPNLDQIHALIRNYGPTVYFHPDEVYLPSSVSWFFQNGAQLYKRGYSNGETINVEGSNLPGGGTNDGEYWVDLPCDFRKDSVKRGCLASAKLYVHVKPASGGTFTDIAVWGFCPFNGPATLKVGMMSISLGKIGQHVGDWEHFTLRVSNFTGELWSIYYSQHSGGQWVETFDLEFIEGNKSIVYSSKNGHASFPHPGTYLQGSSKLGIGIRNDAAQSDYFVDSSLQYEIVGAEYLGDEVVSEPCWLQYMRKWGPNIVYDSRTELDKIIKRLPRMLHSSVVNFFDKLPAEFYGEEGPTGPKEKNNWFGDERC